MATSEEVSASNAGATEAAAQARTQLDLTDPAAVSNPPNPDRTRPDDATDEEQTPGKRVKASKKFDLVDRFIELSEYTKKDIIGSNESRRTVVTDNGGKYEVSVKGTKLRKLAGPDTPATRDAREEETDD